MTQRRDIKSAFENRRGEVERISNAEAQYFKVSGVINVTQTGEAVVDVDFPVLFVELPRFSSGATLGAGQPVTPGAMPTAHCVVLRWGEKIRDDGTVIYSGATMGLIVTGNFGQTLDVHYHFEGTALQGPVPNA